MEGRELPEGIQFVEACGGGAATLPFRDPAGCGPLDLKSGIQSRE